jgi:hypothetical protein
MVPLQNNTLYINIIKVTSFILLLGIHIVLYFHSQIQPYGQELILIWNALGFPSQILNVAYSHGFSHLYLQ